MYGRRRANRPRGGEGPTVDGSRRRPGGSNAAETGTYLFWYRANPGGNTRRSMAQSQRTSGGKGRTGDGVGPVDLLRSTLSSVFSTFEADDGEYEEADAEQTDTESPVGSGAADGSSADAEPAPPIDFAAMEPESALYALLCREDGKMKQSAMVTETGWSKSKVSRRLSNLEESGRIGRVRQGREKVVFVKPGGSKAGTEAEGVA